jgi:hypothetical protein
LEPVFNLCVAAFLVIMLVAAGSIRTASVGGDLLASTGFPVILIGLGLVLLALIVVGQLRSRRVAGGKRLDLRSPEGRAVAASILLLATLAFAFGAGRAIGCRRTLLLAVFALVLTAVLVLLFGKLFYVPLPRGTGFLRELSYFLYCGNNTDRLDARGMNRLQRSGTLPTVWIPPGELREKRELFRTRMVFTRQRTRLKNRIHASGGKVRLGPLRSDVNRYLKWAFFEAASTVSLNRRRCALRHVSRLYERVRSRRGHQTAIGAVARHLAESTYWILKKGEPYCEPTLKKGTISSTKR